MLKWPHLSLSYKSKATILSIFLKVSFLLKLKELSFYSTFGPKDKILKSLSDNGSQTVQIDLVKFFFSCQKSDQLTLPTFLQNKQKIANKYIRKSVDILSSENSEEIKEMKILKLIYLTSVVLAARRSSYSLGDIN